MIVPSSWIFAASPTEAYPPRSQRVNWQGDSGLTDDYQQKVNLVGGYYDAGDHVKFGLPMAYTITMLSWGAREYHRSMMDLNQMGHVLDAIKWGTDYFIKWGMFRPYNSSYSDLLLVHAKQVVMKSQTRITFHILKWLDVKLLVLFHSFFGLPIGFGDCSRIQSRVRRS
ncbi:hypothetical protein L1887_02375 [Cichorium endivia]|nr:hypothetical protein L1887_02375 [Cichorium endivia]